jgi:hypothetical protein
LRNPEVIQALLHFVNGRLDGWFDPTDTPVPDVQAIFYSQERSIGLFASGKNFFMRGQFPASAIVIAIARAVCSESTVLIA